MFISDIPLDYSIKDLSIHCIHVAQTITDNSFSVIYFYRNSINGPIRNSDTKPIFIDNRAED